MTKERGFIYLVHFERPYQHAKHYLGWTTRLQQRFYRHTADSPVRRGSALMRAVVQAGIRFKVVRVWAGKTREEERRLHILSHLGNHCPVCRGEVPYGAAENFILEEGA